MKKTNRARNIINYHKINVKVYAAIDCPDDAIGSATQGKVEGHVLHTFSLNNPFLKLVTQLSLSGIIILKSIIQKRKGKGPYHYGQGCCIHEDIEYNADCSNNKGPSPMSML